jgi:uncharacterized protein
VIRDIFDTSTVKRSPADWALQWIWNQPEVSVVLSGMSTMSQVEDNLRSAANSGAQILSPEEIALIADAREKYMERLMIPCSKCGYCMPCPNGVDIPFNFEMYNYAHLFENIDDARFRYQIFIKEEQRAGACVECGICEDLCPQKISISQWMKKVSSLLG